MSARTRWAGGVRGTFPAIRVGLSALLQGMGRVWVETTGAT